MNLRAVSKKLEAVAVIISLAAFACGIGTNTFEVSYLAIPAFWLLLLLSLITVALSFPRWQSLFALLLLPVSLICAMGGLPYLYHSTHPAPDGQYQLVVYSRMLPIAFPGQGSDAPGYVQLQDQAGRVIGSTHLYMVQQVYDARWEEDKVEFGLGRKAKSIPLR